MFGGTSSLETRFGLTSSFSYGIYHLNQGRIWALGHLGSGPGRSPKILLYIGFFSIKKSSSKYISAKKYGPKDLLLAPIEPGAGVLP
jgi:hypothetical protein